MNERFFSFATEHVTIAAIGVVLLLGYWLPHLLARRPPSAPAFLMILGLAAYTFIPGMPGALDPTAAPRIWERSTEFVVIVVLFATGLRIDDIGNHRRWIPTIRLLAIAMPLTIGTVAMLGGALAGMTVAGAMLLGAVLAPTDPVLAGDLQVGPPLEGGEHPVRFTLTTEAGLNDGLAFPFVYLALLFAVEGGASAEGLFQWLVKDVLYRIGTGAALGALVGWVLGKIMFGIPDRNPLARTGSGVLALAGVLLCYGIVELAEGYGFIGVFVAGVVCRRVEQNHEFHRRLHTFSEAIEHTVTAVLLVWLGAALPALSAYLDWRHMTVGLSLLLIIRPLSGWICCIGTELTARDRAIISFYGVRGIGSVYYLAYAAGHVEFVNEGQVWALVAYTILGSTLIHGTTARLFIPRTSKDG